ncbi:hypothetical protein O6H91_04G021700 [Diphasiastrum complanatum]|uniref:Uncharacterized protein n=1 Tax=Diphasiastrum complanatum TaxID=34168 RepID=A0ACC2DUS4_DIPCM|nr:hypothetical protein O6H91_04G021700 [Diphasiastrum complanatum]
MDEETRQDFCDGHRTPSPTSPPFHFNNWRTEQSFIESNAATRIREREQSEVAEQDIQRLNMDAGMMEDDDNIDFSSVRLEDFDENEICSPKTPRSTLRSQIMECPGAPSSRSIRREIIRQSSLNDTKLLMTTKLKRTFSIFLFDKHFEYLREIGSGSMSTVYEARDRRNGTLCAIKMSKQPFLAREDRELYLREIQSVADLPEHPNVVKYFRGWQQDFHFYIQMELCDGGNLRLLLDSLENPLSDHQIWSFIEQVASGLDHIHSNNVLHLDIKPENILVDSKEVLKIGDFGLAISNSLWDWEEGDGRYVAPELLRDQEPSPDADMYSFGVMIYEWVTGNKLPHSSPERKNEVEVLSDRPQALKNLVHALLDLDPDKRPSAGDVKVWRHQRGQL